MSDLISCSHTGSPSVVVKLAELGELGLLRLSRGLYAASLNLVYAVHLALHVRVRGLVGLHRHLYLLLVLLLMLSRRLSHLSQTLYEEHGSLCSSLHLNRLFALC